MKTSRRKQTNPNRVAAGTRDTDPLDKVGLTNNDTVADWKEEEAENKKTCMEVDFTSQPVMTNGEIVGGDQPLDMHVSTNVYPHYPDSFSNQGELRDRKGDSLGPDIKKPRLGINLDNFPTAYHKLGRELQEITEPPLSNGHVERERSPVTSSTYSMPSPRDTPQSLPSNLISSEKTGEETPNPEHHHSSPPVAPRVCKDSTGELVNGKSDRIFHMDAYCELCDREFCNKYFLKTHKANKHGIYEDNSPPASSVPLPFPGLMMHQDPLSSFNFKMDTMKVPSAEPVLPWSFKLESPSQQTKKPDSSPEMKPADNSLPFFPMSVHGLESSKLLANKNNSNNNITNGNGGHSGPIISSSINTSSSTSILTTITNSIKSGSTSNNVPQTHDPSMEDYCHICQKHFCNKYYLKKHKQDVHGIAPENPPSSSNKRSRSSLLDLPMTPNNHMMLPQPLASFAGMHGIPGMPGLPNMPPGLMVINPYSLPPVAIIPAGSLMPGQQIHPPSHPIISQPMSMTPLSESAMLSHAPPTPVSLSSANSSDYTPNKPSPNVQESGAHCSICSKEFCNEFYLQIHKESKHGIRRGSDDGSRDKAISLVKDNKHERSSPIPSAAKNEASAVRTRSPTDPSPSAEGHILFCNMCNKDFTNKYLYRIHRIHDHGLNEFLNPSLVENGELHQKEDAMLNMNESIMRMTASLPSMNYASSFRSSSNKPQESVVCDICNKQITNEYFLRLHKYNVHGIDPCTNEKYESRPLSSPVIPISRARTPSSPGSLSITSYSQPLNLTPQPGKHPMLPFLPPKMDFKDMPPFSDFTRELKSYRDVPSFLTDTINHELFARSQNHARHLDLNFFGLPSLGKLQSEENMKMNFDPEAYCEICKKEFCSKYFLRTHKQNIHGIKSDTSSSSSSKGSENDKIYSMSPLKPNTIVNDSVKSNEVLDKSSWRWKEPINSSRVICDICNKEVCNKYFLRTHKQKKHGIVPTSQSPNISTNGSPVASDCDTASNASSQPDDKSFRLDTLNLPQMIPLPSAERLHEKFHMKTVNFDKGKEVIHNNNNNTEQSETCNICNRRFKNCYWLKDHIVKEHSDSEALDMRSKSSLHVYTCQVCGTDFPAELSVQLHLIQEHNARVTLDTDEPQVPMEEATLPNCEGNSKVAELSGRWTLRKKGSSHRRLKKYVCSRCGFDSHWLSSLLDHERNEHGIVSGTSPVYSCSSCHHLLPTSNSLSAHMVIAHGFSSEEALHEVKLVEPSIPNNFRCAHCPAVFPTRTWGMAHVRHVHIRSRRDLAVKNSFEKSLLQCPSCPFKTHFAFRLQRHVKCRHTTNLPSSHYLYSTPSRITSNSNLNKFSNVPRPTSASKDDNSLLGATAMYKSIAASLLSAPETSRAESPTVDRDDIILQSFKLPMGSVPIEPTPFKLATHTSAASTVVGL